MQLSRRSERSELVPFDRAGKEIVHRGKDLSGPGPGNGGFLQKQESDRADTNWWMSVPVPSDVFSQITTWCER